MLQQVDYETQEFIRWTARFPMYLTVMKRKRLILTTKAKLLLAVAYTTLILLYLFAVYLIVMQSYTDAGLIILFTPGFVVLQLMCLSAIGSIVLKTHRRTGIITASQIMSEHPGKKIVIVGSYGKTTAKELISKVLKSEKKVAYSPGNRNVLVSHAKWINSELKGDEDYVIIEFGEYRSGDIAQLAELTHPDYAIITGYAPNHLDTYKTEKALKEDLRSIQNYVNRSKLFVSEQAGKELGIDYDFNDSRVKDWKVTNSLVSLEGTSFKLTKNDEETIVQTKLIGRHLIGITATVYIIASQLGISKNKVLKALSLIEPYDHRMKPKYVHGAWIIDDTYNGNLEGIKAGLAFMKEISAKRKIYVTPGLVEQGTKKELVHKEIAEKLMGADIDELVLMENSSTKIIADELHKKGYRNKITLINDPLDYYLGLEYSLVDGDVVLLQNDWTDNYH